MKRTRVSTLAFACALAASVFVAEVTFEGGFRMRTAEARVGRPVTPVSYAGVARRTTRRRVVATSVYVAALPSGCTTVVVEGATLHQCGTTYYQPSGSQYVVVNVK